MQAREFSLKTVTTFLEYLYAKAFEGKFDETKTTPELMRLCHVYQVQDLYDLSMNHLLENTCDANAVSIWFEAEKMKNENLKKHATDFLGNKRKEMGSVDDIDKAYNGGNKRFKNV